MCLQDEPACFSVILNMGKIAETIDRHIGGRVQ